MSEETPPQEGQENQQPPSEGTPTPKTPEDNYWKRQAEKHQRELEKLQRANMTEAEKAKAERDDATRRATQLETELRETKVRSRFETAAAKAGAIDPEAAYKLANTASLKVKDDGSIEGIDQALADLRKSRPYLFGQKTSTGTPGGAAVSPPPSNPNQAVNDAIRARWRR
ncbi:MAG: phage scaffolding protein [Candidatus Xenobium sp.]|jgi:hypothetical protein